MLARHASAHPNHITTAYTLSLLSEYNHTLDSLPLDLSRNFADLRELDAVLSSSMGSITTRIHTLTKMIEENSVPKEERLWLLTEIAEEAARLKLGGEDKIRVACQAADNLKWHTSHLRDLLRHLPGWDVAELVRTVTTYPHISNREVLVGDSGRRRRVFGAFMTGNSEASPTKRRRAARDDDGERSARKERTTDALPQRSRNGARSRRYVCFLYAERSLNLGNSDKSGPRHLPNPSYPSLRTWLDRTRITQGHPDLEHLRRRIGLGITLLRQTNVPVNPQRQSLCKKVPRYKIIWPMRDPIRIIVERRLLHPHQVHLLLTLRCLCHTPLLLTGSTCTTYRGRYQTRMSGFRTLHSWRVRGCLLRGRHLFHVL